MGRKKYSRPAVESETVFEQTSLACTTTEALPEFAVTVESLVLKPVVLATFVVVWECEQDVSKGGNFDRTCGEVALSLLDTCVVPLS